MRRGAKGPDDSSGDELDEFGKGSSHSASNSGIKFWTWDQEKVVTEVLSCIERLELGYVQVHGFSDIL